jgi:hypothetical protein
MYPPRLPKAESPENPTEPRSLGKGGRWFSLLAQLDLVSSALIAFRTPDPLIVYTRLCTIRSYSFVSRLTSKTL